MINKKYKLIKLSLLNGLILGGLFITRIVYASAGDTTAGAVAYGPMKLLGAIIDALRWVAGALVALGGMLLNGALQFSVQTSNFIGEGSAVGSSIDAGWVIIRDLINMSFIFIVLYIAINTILGLSGGADKRTLSRLVIAALLINFSKFIAGVVFDVGNMLALGFYAAVDGANLSEVIMDGLKIMDNFTSIGFFSGLEANSAALGAKLLLLILVIITAVSFIYASILFIGRILMIVILLMSSPIGFAGMVLPSLNKYSSQWWNELINQSMVAPVFLFFMYILVKMINTLSIIVDSSQDNLQIATMVNFAIMIGFVVYAVKITKSMSGAIGGAATAIAGIAASAAMGGAALLGRGVIGRGAGMIAKSGAGQKLANLGRNDDGTEKTGSGAWLQRNVAAKAGMATLGAAQRSTFDARQTKIGSNVTGRIKAQTGFDLTGNQAKGGFSGAIKRREDKQKEKAKRYETAGFETEADRVKEETGIAASAAKAATAKIFGKDAWKNSPWFRSAFKGEVSAERAKKKKDKKEKENEERKKYTEQIDQINKVERQKERGGTPNIYIRIIEEPGKPARYEIPETDPSRLVRNPATHVVQEIDPATGGLVVPAEENKIKQKSPDATVRYVHSMEDEFDTLAAKAKAYMGELRADIRFKAQKPEDGGGAKKETSDKP